MRGAATRSPSAKAPTAGDRRVRGGVGTASALGRLQVTPVPALGCKTRLSQKISPVDLTGGPMATTYKPGDTVPRDGKVECTQYNGTQDNARQSGYQVCAM